MQSFAFVLHCVGHSPYIVPAMPPSPRSSITLKEVAQAAGVHVSTVSRALDPARRELISADVLQKVETAARRLGYRPNRAASALRTGRSHTIGVLLPDISNAVFAPILEGIEASAAAHGYFVLVANVGDASKAQSVVERLLSQRVDGLLMASARREDPLIEFMLRHRIKAVLVNRADELGRLPAVVSDDRLAMKLAVDHLVQLGHRRIAHLAGPQDLPTGVGRRLGFEQALRDHDLQPLAVQACSAYSREAGREAIEALLQQGVRPQAVVCSNDLVALGAYDGLRQAGLSVPGDVSVTGHNDMPLVDMVEPPLTTIRLPHRELGWRAAQMLFEELGADDLSATTVVLRPTLVVRGSTAAPR